MGATTQLFVGRLPREMRSSELERIFEKHGKLSRCDVKQGNNLCYGFVEYDIFEDAEEALKKCNGMSIQGEQIVVEFAKGAARTRDDNTCFRCNKEGHWARDCPDSRRGGRSRSRSPRSFRGRGRDRDRDRGRDRSRSRSRGRRHRSDRRESSRSRRHRSRSASPSRRRNDRSHHRERGNRGSRRSRSRSRPRGDSSRKSGGRSPRRGRGGNYNDRDAPQTWDKKSADSAVGDSGPEDYPANNANGYDASEHDQADDSGWGA
ncbi:hypothetical protein LPJ53_004427 [Coemansia erecta]|uniref:RNA-binding domain-containing protein n=1 Tax=Coemansia erecta TaxID=147472 RepID=A0A9W7XYY3_9FUNG|nr:hypothetical protein LPJ53_004427 [Coemansia erecta]